MKLSTIAKNILKEASGNATTFYRADRRDKTEFSDTYWSTDIEDVKTYVYSDRCMYSATIHLKNPNVVDEINDITDWNFDDFGLEAEGYDGLMFTNSKFTLVYVFSDSSVRDVKKLDDNI